MYFLSQADQVYYSSLIQDQNICLFIICNSLYIIDNTGTWK